MRVLLSDQEHFGDEVGGDNATGGSHGFGKGECRFTGPAGKVEDLQIGGELGALKDKFGGGTRLKREFVEPFFPKRSGFEPFLSNDFLRIETLRGIRAQLPPPPKRANKRKSEVYDAAVNENRNIQIGGNRSACRGSPRQAIRTERLQGFGPMR